MPDQAHDHFDRYFAEKLWTMIPEYYRDQDGLANPPGVLRGFIEVLAQQAATLRRSNDRLWEDQFIDLCSEWAVPYIGQLVGTRLLSPLNRRGRRVDVAKTIYYRRRAGTPRVLEELIADITGWEGKLVEEFKRLGRMRHGLDPEPGGYAGSLTGTMPGGWADLRNAHGAELADSPFDEYFHMPDFRQPSPNGAGLDGRYSIAKLGFHLYRLASTRVASVLPYPLNGTGATATQFTFDPSGRDIPLFISPYRTNGNAPTDWNQWVSAEEWQVPGPTSCRLLNRAEAKKLLLPNNASNEGNASIALRDLTGSLVDIDHIAAGNLISWPAQMSATWLIDPVRGRLIVPNGAPGKSSPPIVLYYYGFSGKIGAGGYDRSNSLTAGPTLKISNTTSSPAALGGLPGAGVVEIEDSSTYTAGGAITSVTELTVQAANPERPYIRLTANLDFTATNAPLPSPNPDGIPALTLNGLWIGSEAAAKGSAVRLIGDFTTVTLLNMSLDPGGKDSTGSTINPVDLVVQNSIQKLVIENSIIGSIILEGDGSIEQLEISDSIVDLQNAPSQSLSLAECKVMLERVTVFGNLIVDWLYATETIITGIANVANTQAGCFRFSASLAASRVPHAFESNFPADFAGMFTSKIFGQPGYAQLSLIAPDFLQTGAENRSEIGAFSSLMNPIKLDGLKAKIGEYAPFGLLPVFIFET